MTALTTKDRAALPDSDFAVPGKRKMPIHDVAHVEMAWREVDRTQGLSEEERTQARHRIMTRAAALGIDTSGWSTLKACLEFEAMSLQVPQTDGHENKMPFSGVMTRVDEPSDSPPHGSGGRRVLLTTAAAEAALPGLLGMGVDCTPDLGAHDAQKKIGVITGATIVGNAIHIEGFIWASDFPDTAARIRATKDVLGFSYEMKNVQVADPGAAILVIDSCTFTGAAILKKADAAYTTTSLAASKDRQSGDIDMTKEEMEAMFGTALAKALEPVNTELAALKASTTAITTDLAASKEVEAKVRPLSDQLRACSAAMQAAGVGQDPVRGHGTVINKIADHMDASAAMGKVPHIYRDHDFLIDASKDKTTDSPDIAKAIKEGIDAALAPLKTVIEDLKAKAFNAAAEPARKSLSPDLTKLLVKNGLKAAGEGEEAPKVSLATFDGWLDASGVDRNQAMTLKLNARECGILEAA